MLSSLNIKASGSKIGKALSGCLPKLSCTRTASPKRIWSKCRWPHNHLRVREILAWIHSWRGLIQPHRAKRRMPKNAACGTCCRLTCSRPLSSGDGLLRRRRDNRRGPASNFCGMLRRRRRSRPSQNVRRVAQRRAALTVELSARKVAMRGTYPRKKVTASVAEPDG